MCVLLCGGWDVVIIVVLLSSHFSLCDVSVIAAPLGTFRLDMTDGYNLAIMYELLDIVAKHPSYQFQKVTYEDTEEMRFLVIEEKVTKMSPTEEALLASLKKNLAIAADTDSCAGHFTVRESDSVWDALFAGNILIALLKLLRVWCMLTRCGVWWRTQLMAGDSADISEQQFYALLDQVGFSLDDRKKASIMSICDSDRSGKVQLDEFLEFLSEVRTVNRLSVHIHIDICIYRHTQVYTCLSIYPLTNSRENLTDGFMLSDDQRHQTTSP